MQCHFLFLLVLTTCQPKQQIWESCQYAECDNSLYCIYGKDIITELDHYFCTSMCSQNEDCPIGPDDATSNCKILFGNEGICMIPCGYYFEDGCPDSMKCADIFGLKQKYCW